MIGTLSKKITNTLIEKESISKDDRELYEYGFFILLSNLYFTVITCLCGLIFGVFFQSLIFFISFMLIRKYAGGYHAKTEARCQIFSTLSIILSVVTIRFVNFDKISVLLLALTIIASILIFAFAPLDTAEKPLSIKEKNYFRKISYIILIVLDVLFVVTFILKLNIVFAPIAVAILFESILISLGKISRCKR